MITNYHTHCAFCDGKLMPEDYVLSAVKKGFTSIGFTSHAPVLFETDWTMKPTNLPIYIDLINSLKGKYKNEIQIYTGLETDYYPGCKDYRDYPGVDYTIGAIHFIYDEKNRKYMALDGSIDEFIETLDITFNGDIQALVEVYYDLLREMLKTHTPDILAHLDVIKKNNINNQFFIETDSWYRKQVEELLKIIKKNNVIVEVNTGGISRGYTTDVYPSSWILRLMKQMDIPLVLNSDAHHPDWIDTYYNNALDIIKKSGYTHERILYDGHWQDVIL
ncbi:MAG TPA: histidinol-phosphatase [Thermoclostridium sp.]|nr:histidinol-phosphatase [Thermoclostridium sp.]